MKEKLKEHTGAMLGIVLLVVTLSILSMFGGAIMKLFGFQYDSIGKMITFFLIVGVLGYPIEQCTNALPRVLLKLKKINVAFARALYLLLDTTATVLVMVLVDHVMESVSGTGISFLVIAFIMAVANVSDIKTDPVGEEL